MPGGGSVPAHTELPSQRSRDRKLVEHQMHQVGTALEVCGVGAGVLPFVGGLGRLLWRADTGAKA